MSSQKTSLWFSTFLTLALAIPAMHPLLAKTCPLTTGVAYKIGDEPGVYYVTLECTKRVFPDQATYFTYFDSWSAVKKVDGAALAKVKIDDDIFVSPKSISVAATSTESAVVPTQWQFNSTIADNAELGSSVPIKVAATAPAAGTYLIDVEIYTNDTKKAGQKFFDNQFFQAGETKNYSFSWPTKSGAGTGVYVVKMGAFTPHWKKSIAWEQNVAPFVVYQGEKPIAPLRWKVNVSAQDNASTGDVVPITVTATAPKQGQFLIDIEVFDKDKKVGQAYYDQEPFSPGMTRTYTYNWKPQNGILAGKYKVKIGIFMPTWGANEYWNEQAKDITINYPQFSK